MGHACTHRDGPDPHEHPIVAVVAIIAMIAAILLIAWARFEVHGTGDIQAALAEPPAEGEAPRADPKPDDEVEAAVTSSRFATGFSP